MFPILLKKTRQEIDSLRKSIQTNASLRDLLAQAGEDSPLSIHLRLGKEVWVLSLFEDWKQRIKKWQGVK